MAKSGVIRARVEGLLEKRAKARADVLGLSLTDYLVSLVERDIQFGGNADALARTTAEVNFVSAMMIRRLLLAECGEEELRTIEVNARANAGSTVEMILQAQSRNK